MAGDVVGVDVACSVHRHVELLRRVRAKNCAAKDDSLRPGVIAVLREVTDVGRTDLGATQHDAYLFEVVVEIVRAAVSSRVEADLDGLHLDVAVVRYFDVNTDDFDVIVAFGDFLGVVLTELGNVGNRTVGSLEGDRAGSCASTSASSRSGASPSTRSGTSSCASAYAASVCSGL